MARTKTNDNASKEKNKIITLDKRDDLFEKWIVRNWFVSGIEWGSLKRIFSELFMSLYDDLSERFDSKKCDNYFLNFINVVFPTVLDVYKWHESEKENKDIGLLQALEGISLCDWYIDLLTSYSNQYNS